MYRLRRQDSEKRPQQVRTCVTHGVVNGFLVVGQLISELFHSLGNLVTHRKTSFFVDSIKHKEKLNGSTE